VAQSYKLPSGNCRGGVFLLHLNIKNTLEGIMAKAKSRYQKPKGTADILPGDSELWQKVEAVARDTFHQYGYS